MKNQKTINQLIAKVKEDKRMPSLKAIHKLLEEAGIKHEYIEETVNVVEYRTGQKNYVNSRHNGKIGKMLEVCVGDIYLNMNSSSSYYSWNTWRYAKDLLVILNVED